MPQDTTILLVKAVIFETPEIRLYELRSPDGADLAPFTAGAHIDLHLPNGLIRSYSIVSDQDDRTRYVIGVARDRSSRGGSTHIHDNLRAGDRVEVGPPRNHFELDEQAAESVLIAGGIGVTPMMSMLRRLESIGRRWSLHLACRTRQDAPFRDDLAPHGKNVAFHFDDEQEGRRLDVHRIVENAGPDAHFYCCGPAPMLDVFKRAVAGIPRERVHFEHFAAIDPVASEGGFEVELARSGKLLRVQPGKTILDAVAEAGITVPFSCLAGVCGSCETKVIAGEPDHRDLILTESERRANKSVMICCSGALSDRLVLDL